MENIILLIVVAMSYAIALTIEKWNERNDRK